MIELKDLTRTYKPKKGNEVKALNGINLTIASKGMVFVLGKSGSGKSTLLNVLGGLDKYTSGDIIIKGKSTKDFSQADFDSYRNTLVGFIFQEYNVLNEFTVAQNIGLALQLQGESVTSERLNEILESVDLQGMGSRKPNELSGGQKQRIAIARALIKEPEIIMADEPTGALDSETGKQVFNTLKQLSKTRLVLVVSHDREFAETYADRIIEFKDGNIIRDVSRASSESTNEDQREIKVIDDETIQVKKGYQLTAEDLRVINNYLLNAKNDLRIVSKEGIEKLDNSEFVQTKQEDLKGNQSGSFKMIRSKLPYMTSLKMGASNLKHKKIRLFFSILLTVIALTLFGTADTLGSYNEKNSARNSIIAEGIDYSVFQKNVIVKKENYSYSEVISMTEKDLKFVSSKIGKDYLPIYKFYDTNQFDPYNKQYSREFYNVNIPRSGNMGMSPEYYDVSSYRTASIISNEMIKDLNLKLEGQLPTKVNEVVIPEYRFEVFKHFGYIKGENENNKIEITNYDDIIGKTIRIENKELKVTGVLITGINKDHRYDSLKKNRYDNNVFNYVYSQELRMLLENTHHGSLFFDEKNINEVFSIMANAYDYEIYNKNEPRYQQVSISNIADLTDDKIVFSKNFDKSLTKNDKKGVIISYQNYKNYLFFNSNDESLDNFIRTYLNEKGITDNEVEKEYAYYNVSLTKKYRMYFESFNVSEELRDGLVEKYAKTTDKDYKISIKNNRSKKPDTDYILMGYYKQETDFSNNVVYMNKGEILENYRSYDLEIDAVVSGLSPNDYELLEKNLKLNYENIDGIQYQMINPPIKNLAVLNSTIEQMAPVFFWIGFGFAVFASLLLLNFISAGVSNKRREIGILRALGARSKDVFGIFLKESTIIALINFVIASVATFFLTGYLGKELASTGINVRILIFNYRQVILILLVSLAVAYISSFIPVYGISRKKPIDAIKEK